MINPLHCVQEGYSLVSSLSRRYITRLRLAGHRGLQGPGGGGGGGGGH